jgi:hypothetical protein
MARAVMKYAFAALLGLLSTQAVAPFVRVVASIEIVYSKETRRTDERQTPQQARRVRADVKVLRSARACASRTKPEPDTAALFQCPPPLSSPFS